MSYDVEIISVGNELLIGRTVNTNAAWLGRKLTVRGFNVKRVTMIGDNMEDISSAIKEALARKPRLIIITGGLGPTFDDMTSEALARALGRRWVINEEALKEVSEKYKKLNLNLTNHRVKMAKMPEGSKPLRNPVGTAPGILVEEGGTTILALPGVPSEMKAIFENFEKQLETIGPPYKFSEEYLMVEGVPESSLAPVLEDVMKSVEKIYIKSHPRGKEGLPRIVLHIQSFDKTLEEANMRVKEAEAKLKESLSRLNAKVKQVSPEEVEW